MFITAILGTYGSTVRYSVFYVYVWRIFICSFYFNGLVMGHFARWALETPVTLGFLCYLLVVVPIMGIWAVHKYKWQHWEPFDKGHK